MSNDAFGPVFKPYDQDFFVFTNIGASNGSSGNLATLSNNTIQLTGEVWDGLRMAEPAGTQEMLDAKGKIVLAYENTTEAAPGIVKFDASIVSKIGYKSPEGTMAIFIVNSDPKFYNPTDYDGNSSNNTSASTSTKLDLIGSGWKKAAIQGTEFQFVAEEFSNTAGVKINFDLYNAVTTDGTAVSIIVDNSVAVELDATKLTADRVNSSEPYNIMRPIMDFRNENWVDTKITEGQAHTITASAGQGGYAKGTGSDDTITGSDSPDGIIGDAGDDTLDGAAGADRIEGGLGNDTITGGSNGPANQKDQAGNDILIDGNPVPASVWEYGDRAIYKGKKADFTVTSTDGATFTVTDNKTADGNEGTDTLTGIEIIEFSDEEMVLVVKSDSFSFTDPFTGLTISEDYAEGTKFDDVITGGDGRSMLHGNEGNDVIFGSGQSGAYGDHIEGGAGNDFIDGSNRGTGVMPWENDNVAIYMGAARRFTIEKLNYKTDSYSRTDEDGNTITSQSDAAYLDAKKSNMNSSNITFNTNQVYFVITDSLADADGGLGTDILTNIDELFFDDKGVRLSVFKDPWGGFIEGTRFNDTITGEGVDEFIESGEGNDIVSGGDGADRAVLGRGNDIFDGGGDTKNFDANQFMADNFGGGSAGTFDPNQFMNMMDVGAQAGGEMGGMGGMGDMGGGMGGMGDMGGGMGGMGMDPMATGGGGTYMEPAMTASGSGEMHHHGGMGPTGDTAEYRGDYARYDVKTYTTDANGANAELQSIINSTFSGYSLANETSYTIVKDTNTGKKGTGTDLLVNVEKIQFNDFTFNLAVVQNIQYGDGYGWAGEVNWQGTFGDDDINFNNVKITDSEKSASDTPDRDFMSGEAGNDVMVAGKGGDRLIGGTGNDIMDGGANGTSSNPHDDWLINDVAEYKASIDRFELNKFTFVKKAMVIKDTKGNTVFTITPKTKGTETFGEIKRAGETKSVLKINEGETFFVVSDTLPEEYGGEGTDILLGMEQAQFGFDWDGIVDFQVKYNINQHGGHNGNGDVNAQGTIFGDTINLIAGKAKTDTGGFGGFDDYNTGASIFDANFFTNADVMATEMTAGFDIWNWKPGPDETPVKSVTQITSFYDGEAPITGQFDIYQVNDGTNNRLVAFDTEYMEVFDEVSSSDGNNTFKIGGAAYASANAATGPEKNHNEWMPVQGVDTPVATGVTITFDDGFVSPDKFDIYKLPSSISSTDAWIAWNPTMMMVAEKVKEDSGVWKVQIDTSMFENFDPNATGGAGAGGHSGFGFDLYSWKPAATDNAVATLTELYLPAMDFGGGNTLSEEAISGQYKVYQVNDGEKDILIAIDEEYGGNFQVTYNQSADKYYQFFEMHTNGSPGQSLPGSSNSGSANQNAAANRIHDSYINAGRGNDIILAGQGRDTIEGGRGDDFIDGGSESDFLATLSAATAGGTAIKNQLIENPDTGKKSLYSIYDGGVVNGSQVWWAWDDNKSDPTYFKVNGNTTDGYKAVVQTIDANFYNDRFSQYDEAIYTGSQARYTITEVYLKMLAGQPDLDANNNYQVKSLTEFGAITDSTEKAKWTKVVQVKDVLKDEAGGTGTDYLLNIEEIRFEDGKEQLEIDSFGWPEIRPIQMDWSWTPSGSPVLNNLQSFNWAYGGTNNAYQQNIWDVYNYGQTLADGRTLYAVVNTNWNGPEALVVLESGTINNNPVFVEATDTKYSGSFRGTIKDDTIGHSKNPSKMQDDEIFGKGGNDLVIAGAGVDRIKGGSGDDTIWGGTHTGADSWMFQGDTAFFGGSLGRYDVLQNVYVKASSENGAVDRDASGNVILYRANNESYNYRGVTDGGQKDVDGLAKAQAASGSSAALTLNGDLDTNSNDNIVFTSGRVVTIKSSGDDSGITFTVSGTNEAGGNITDVITGANVGIATGSKYFKTVTGIVASNSTDGNVEAGINWNMSTSELTTANGYYEAVVVVDSLKESSGGDGTDVLIGVEGLMFGHTGSGEHEWLDQVSDHSHGGSAAGMGGATLTKLSITAKGDDQHRNHEWVDGNPTAVSSNGTISSAVTLSTPMALTITRTDGSGQVEYRVTGTGDHDWNPQTADQAIQQDFTLNGNETMHGWKNFKTVTGITLTSGTEDGSIKIGTSGGMVETTRYTAKYEGTDFDDVIFWDEATEFKSDMGTKFSLASTVEMSFDAGKGDDVIYGPTKTKDGKDAGTAADTPNIDYSYVIYSGSKAEYDITLNKEGGQLVSVTVKHNVADSMGGTGVDTLYDVDAARFGSGSNEQWSLFKPEVKSLKEFNPNSGQEEVTGFKIRGTEYNDTVSASSYSTSNDQVIFFQPNGSTGGNDAFTGRTAGKDGLELSGLFSRYDISFNDSNDTWTITDNLPQNKGGDGTITATSIEKIQFGGPFSMKIGSAFAGQKGSDATTQISISREVQKADGGFHSYEFGKFSVLAGDGTLLTSVGADDDGIAENQTVGSATNLTLNGSLDTNNDDNISLADNYAGKFISITSAAGGNDSGITFTVTGTNWAGTEITDVITGADATGGATTVYGAKEFKTVTQVASSGASAGNVKIGVANEMFMPAGYETTDHDGDNNNANGNTLITPAILYGAAQTNDAATLIAAIDGNSDGTVTQAEVETKRGADQSFFGGWEAGKNYHIQMESGGFNSNTGLFEYGGSNQKLQFEFFGEGSDDKFFGSANNDSFSGAPGNDVFWGRGEEKAEWWDTYNSGDKAIYDGVSARYTISAKQTDVDANNDNTWDNTKITKAEFNAWLAANSGNGSANDAPKYFTVTDSLDKIYGGDGIDVLVDIEKVEFSDKMYSLEIQTIKNDWDINTTILGTSGNDTIDGSLTNDSSSDKDYQINPGAGNDVIVGGIEPTDQGFVWGDTAVYDAQSKYFDISVKEYAFEMNAGKTAVTAHGGIDWNASGGSADSNDLTFAQALFARFGGERINQITVTDSRSDAAGGLGTDVMYGIEHIEFRSGEFGDMFDLSPSISRDNSGNAIDFWGTNFGDVFVGDAGSTWVNAQGGNDWIIALNGADRIQPGAGADYVNAGANDNGPTGDNWFRDEVSFWDTPYARTEVSQIKVQVHNTTGDILLHAADSDGVRDDHFLIYNYSGSAAHGEGYSEDVMINDIVTVFDNTTRFSSDYTWTDAFLVTDTLAMSEKGSIGVNVLVGVEAIGFSDEILDVLPTTDTWSWEDWNGNTITESNKKGTPFDDTMTGGSGTDILNGGAGHDKLSSAAGGDRLKGGKGNDILDGGADGTSGESWRDLDIAEYNGIEKQYDIYQVKVNSSSLTPNNTTIFDAGGKLEAALGLTDVNGNGTADTVVLDGFTVVRSNGTQGSMTDTAFIVVDSLPAKMGGTGNDLLINVEQVQFQDGQKDLGLRIVKDNWDGDNSNGYEWVEVVGTDGADEITAWGSGTDLDGTSKTTTTSDDVTADNEIRGKGGDDIIFGYAGGDRIEGGLGNDFIDGGADGITQGGWTPKDEAIYSGPTKNYTINTYSKTDTALTDLMTQLGISQSSVGWSNYTDKQQFVVVTDKLPGDMGGTGTDILTNVEFISFQDQFLPLAKEEFIDVDPNTGLEVRRYVNGTSAADTIEGGVGNDDLFGNGGNDTISGGIGGDYITPGKGDDIIDGGADGTSQWDGSKLFDVVIFNGNYADFEIEDKEVAGKDANGNDIKILQITVSDPSPNGEGTDVLTNVETLQFHDQTVFVGVTESQRFIWNGTEEVAGGSDIYGSIFGDTIQGTNSDDGISGGKGADTIYGNDGPDWIKGGLGNDIIYGGKNGLDAWGNPGDDVASYSGNKSNYTITFYDSSGSTTSTYQADGYVKVKDSRTDESVSEGTDTLYGIEGLEFWDDYVGFKKVETFIDLDGDGKPDVGGKKGTSGSDLLEGSKMDEKLEGKVGDDILSGGGGDDTLIGGVGSDTLIGGNGGATDTAVFEGSAANYTVTEVNKWVAHKSDGTYELDASGNPKIYEHVHQDNAQALLNATTITSAGTLTMNGTLVPSGGNASDDATLTGGKYFVAEGSGDNTDTKFTITGLDASGATVTDIVTGVNNGKAFGDQLFVKITEVSVAFTGGDTSTDGNVKLGASSFANESTTASKGFSVVTKDADGDGTISDSEKSGSSVTDLVFEMENLQFSDTVARTNKQISADDYDHDFVIDVAEILGAIGNDSFKSNASDLNSILPDWVLDQEGGSGNEAAALKALFEADNFFDGGAGRDDIHAGAGDDTIDPGAKSGDAGDVVDGGDGMDVLILSGKSTDWTTDANGDSSTDVGVGTYAGYDLTGFTMYTNKNGTTSDTSDDWVVYVKNIEAIEFEDVFQSLQTTVKDIDQDGDGIVDQVMVKGAATAETVTGSVVEGQDVDSIAAAAAITNAANPIALAAGDEDGFFSGSASAGALSLSGALVSSSIGDTGGKLVSIKSNADDSGLKFTVTGTDLEGNPQTEVVTGPDTGAVNTTKVFKTVEKIVSSGTSSGTIKAGTASGGKLGDGQYVTITSAGNDKDIEFTVTGKDKDGNVQVEVIGGTNVGEVVGGKLFTEVTSVKASAATAGTISVGSVDQYVSKEDFIDAGAGDDVISAGDGGDIIIGGAGSDFMFGGANSGTDENGDPNKDVAKFNGRLTSVDLDGDGSISDAESADYSIAQNGFIICNGIIDSNGVCILTTLSGSTTAADDDAVVNGAAKLNAAGDLAGISSTAVDSAVTIKSAGDDSGVTFTITGTDEAGATITEKVTGAKTGVAYGKKVFKTVTKVSADKATANTVSVGKDAVVAKSEDRIGDNEIDATTKPTIFTSASTAIAVKVAHDYDNNGDNQKDTFEVAGRADGVSLKASISGSANLALTGSEASGGSVKCVESQNVKIKSYGNDSSINFTVTGTDDSGATITEVIKGSNQGEAIGSKLFKTITQIATNGSSAADVEVGLTSFYLDLDGDNKADLLTDGKFLNDLNGDGDYTDAGEYEISLDTNKMSVDEIVVATLDVDGDGNTNENGDVAGHQIFDAHEIRPVYEITDLNNKDSNDNPIKDWAIEIEEFEFTDGKVQTGPTKQSQVTFSITEGITEEVDHVGSNFADEIISGTTKDFMTGGGGADYFVFGTGTGVDTIKDFVAKAVTDDSGNITTHADVIKILKNVNGQSLDTASQAKGRASSTTNGTRIDLGNGNSITLEGVNSSDLTDANFMVVDVL